MNDIEEPHPLDEALGNIHECALSLAFAGQHDIALILGKAHEEIQQYLMLESEPLP